MDILSQIRQRLGTHWIPAIYEEQVRPLRTRVLELNVPEKENKPVVLHTLLGVELKVGRLRISCPDLGTARYAAVFAAAGCRTIAVPYDITRIPEMADNLEAAWSRMNTILAETAENLSPQAKGRLRTRLIRAVREDVAAIGAGARMPLFNTSTRQRDA